MRKILCFFMAATVMLLAAGCNSKEKEETVYGRVSKSTNKNELRAYIYNYSDEAPAEHLAKVRNLLKELVADSTAYANIKKTTNAKERMALEGEYLEKFENGQHKREIDSLFEVDQKAVKAAAEADERKMRSQVFSGVYLVDCVYTRSENQMCGYVFGKSNSEGKGRGAFIDEKDGFVEKFRYEISAVPDELEITPVDGGESQTVSFTVQGIVVDGFLYVRMNGAQIYNQVKKYI